MKSYASDFDLHYCFYRFCSDQWFVWTCELQGCNSVTVQSQTAATRKACLSEQGEHLSDAYLLQQHHNSMLNTSFISIYSKQNKQKSTLNISACSSILYKKYWLHEKKICNLKIKFLYVIYPALQGAGYL